MLASSFWKICLGVRGNVEDDRCDSKEKNGGLMGLEERTNADCSSIISVIVGLVDVIIGSRQWWVSIGVGTGEGVVVTGGTEEESRKDIF